MRTDSSCASGRTSSERRGWADASLQRLLDITIALSGERQIDRLYDQIVQAAQDLTHADGATLYIADEAAGKAVLRFKVLRNHTLEAHHAACGESPAFAGSGAIPLFHDDGAPNESHVCAWVYHHRERVNMDDVYTAAQFDFSGTRAFDAQSGYRSKSMLTVPLANHAGDVIGVLQLINALDAQTGAPIAFHPELEPIAAALASSAAITLDNQLLLQGHRDLLDAFVKAIAKAIDAKSAHTSAHCQRVPALTEMLAQAACDVRTGPLQDFSLDDDGWYELRVAAWLHDCGKLATPDYLLDKSTKLHALSDRIETVKARFAAVVAGLEGRVAQAATPAECAALQAEIAARRDDCAFLEAVNRGGESMCPEDQARVRRIAALQWRDVAGQLQALLTPEEADLLCIERGTLSAPERDRINDHINVTIDMLEALPFPRQLARVPEYAGGHHERVDGRGYPKGLRGDQMSWPARMMAIADVFEALTSADRPYKPPMKLSQALGILRRMAASGHIDPDLYALFIAGDVWRTYARDYLLPEQCDVEDAASYALGG